MLPAPMDEHPTAAIPPRTSQATIFFPLLARGRTDDGRRRTEDGGRRADDEGQRIAVRPARPTVFVYSVYFVVQFFTSFAFFLTTVASAKVVAATVTMSNSENPVNPASPSTRSTRLKEPFYHTTTHFNKFLPPPEERMRI